MRRRDALLLAALSLVLSLLFASSAYASVSSELSDDGQDYGWLYRKGDYLYRIDKPSEDMLVFVDGKWYLSSRHVQQSYPPGKYVRQHPVWEYTYDDGTVCFQCGGQVYLPAVVSHTGFYGNLHSGQISANVNGSEYPRLRCLRYIGGKTYMEASDITRVVFDEDIVPYWSYDPPKYGDRWFEDFSRLSTIEGLTNLPTKHMMTMERMFAGCSQLAELDLSSFDSAVCDNFAEMFDGCISLERLTFGDGWTQGGARQAASEELAVKLLETIGLDDGTAEEEQGQGDGEESSLSTNVQVSWVDGVMYLEGDAAYVDGTLVLGGRKDGEYTYPVEPPAQDARYATFPVAMSCERDGETVIYQAGDVIPDGPGTYVVYGRTPLRGLRVTLTSSDGTTWSSDDESADTNLLVCDYEETGAEPAVTVIDGERQLVEGVDYSVSYVNNVEDGHAGVVIASLGGDYYGRLSVPFLVEDSGAYAYLYDNGLLCLKAGHGRPSNTIVSASRPIVLSTRWFDAATEDPGSEVPWADHAASVKRVIIDESFARFAPVSTAGWFAGCSQLASIEGLRNVNGSSLASMARMFEGCALLAEIDLTGLATEGVRDVSGLARGCAGLERLVLGDASFASVTDSAGYVEGCTKLTEIVTKVGWHNASDQAGRLVLPSAAFKTSPGFARMKAGDPLASAATTYRLRDLALQFATVEMATDTYTCTGSPVKPKMTVKLGNVVLAEGIDYAVAYADNVYPGKAKATITGKGIFSGGLVVPFAIKARVTKVGDRLRYTDRYGTYTLKVTKVAKSGRTAEATVLSVQMEPGASTMYLPSQCTIGGVKVSVTAVSSKLKGSFANVSTVVIGAKVTKIGARAFSRAYSVTTLVIKSKRLKRVKNCLVGSNIYRVQTKVKLTRARRRKYERWFTNAATVGRYVSYTYG